MYLNGPIFIKETESIINDLTKHKAPSPNGHTGELYHTLKKRNQFSAIYSRKQNQQEHFLIHPMRPKLILYINNKLLEREIKKKSHL